MDPAENIHIEANKISFNYHVFLLFIPAIVFVLVLAFIISANKQAQLAEGSGTYVLGNTTDSQ